MHRPRFERRVVLTQRVLASLVLTAVVGLTAFPSAPLALTSTSPRDLSSSGATARTIGSDDYPSYLKNAGQDTVADPWNFWNRECTSFVAWRLNHDAGVPFHNYYLGPHWGDASNWRYAAQQVGITVDDNAERGAVAWWAKGSPGSSAGHVAWVMAASDSSITIEEYNYVTRGGYSQRVLFPGSSSYPTGFIHLDAVTLRNTGQPSISGTPKVGVALSANPGSWSPSGASFAYQWLADGDPVPGATSRTFTPGPGLVGTNLRVRVTASKAGAKSVSATSDRTSRVLRGDMSVLDRPAVLGTPQVGVQLTSERGDWSPAGDTYTFQWLADGVPIEGADRRVFTPRAAQLGTRIQLQVTAKATGYLASTAHSYRTDAVAPGVLDPVAPPVISGTPQVDAQLSATGGQWSPSADFEYQWRAGGDPIEGANASTFKPTAEQLGQKISVRVKAVRDGYATAKTGTATDSRVTRATFTTVGTPTIEGTPQVDHALTAHPGSWSPSGTPSYQWSVAGAPVAGATERTFTPRPEDVREQVTVAVTMRRAGYRTTTAASAPSDAVMPGTFASSSEPSISGTPRVGRTLTADPGGWSPTPTLSYQWLADGDPVPGATEATFTPAASELGKHLSVEVTARRTGYLTALTESARTAAVAPGTITSTTPPEVSGDPVVGGTLGASPGTWSVRPSDVSYQWLADGEPIDGATQSTYSPTEAVLDRLISVRVTVTTDGYTPAQHRSAETTAVVLGHAAFAATPTLSGTPSTGHVLRVDPGTVTPSDAAVSYTWLRSGHRVRGAHEATYLLGADDVGERLSVRVSLHAAHWTPTAERVGLGHQVRSVPVVTVTPVVDGHRVVLRLGVSAPGIASPSGRMVATEDGRRVGKAVVSAGHARLPLGAVPSGRHVYVVTYHGPLQVPVTRRVVLRVPR